MQSVFPPGDTISKVESDHNNCYWRETSYMLSTLCRVVNPGVGLAKTLQKWKEISKKLKENPRKRKRQVEFLCQS